MFVKIAALMTGGRIELEGNLTGLSCPLNILAGRASRSYMASCAAKARSISKRKRRKPE